jgi:hypothetical protein
MKTAVARSADPAAETANLSPGRPRIREAAFEDYDRIAALQVRNGLRARSYEDWLAIWTRNPVYIESGGEWPIGWVLEAEGGALVGSIGNVPLAYRFRGRELRAATSCDWVVDARYRSYSMMIMARLIRQKAVDLFICTTVSAAAEPSYRSGFHFLRAPVGSWDRSAFWITNYRGFSQSALTMKLAPVAPALSYPVAAALYCWDRLRGGRSRASGAGSEIELCSEFDSRFDDFWDELKHEKHNSLLAVRTRQTLAWHFRSWLHRRDVWILAIRRRSRLVAYAIFDRPDNPALGLKRVRLVDFQALNGSEEELAPALIWVLRTCREEGVHVLENAGCWLDRPGLPPISAPYTRTLGSWTYYYRATDRELSERLLDPRIWEPSAFDGDASL